MSRLGLFQGFGVELEYMIVDAGTAAVRPVADRVLVEEGAVVSELERGAVAWSNELVNHVLELKTNGPVASLDGLEAVMAGSVREANAALAPLGCTLLGTGAHPFFDPTRETRLWPGEYNEVYRTYDRIFGCRGHGWSNLQSVHLNLPFADDDEFGRLHAAIRVLLPLLPALAASSPYMDGRRVGPLDGRLHVYRHNQDRIPALVGRVVPEPVFSEAEYEARIFRPILDALAPHDPDRVLEKHFANSRGAIARFDRGSVEIRVLDIQERPRADLGVLALVTETLKALVDERWGDGADQRAWDVDPLAETLDGCVADAEAHVIRDGDYLRLFGLEREAATAGDVWRHLADAVGHRLTDAQAEGLAPILEHGTLARRLVGTLGDAPSPEALRRTFLLLADGLREDRPFLPDPALG